MIMLIVTSTFIVSLPSASAVDVAIISLTPSSGEVGTTVRIIGTINKTDGLYRVWFAQQIANETNASGNSVDTTFSIPVFPQGNYTVTLQDVEKNINATEQFQVQSAFYINTIGMPSSPEQLQENSTVYIQANVTGGAANTVYYANITVNAPTPSNETYWHRVILTNTTTTGNGVATVAYPSGFLESPASHTNYTGTYNIAFNKTLATSAFMIGLTNATQYHRYQTVDIKAAGYKPNENVTIKVTLGGKTISPIINVTASEGGLVVADWPIPANASALSTYTVNVTSISSSPTVKKLPDTQSFIVPGFDVNATTENLAQEIVNDVTVQVFENGKSIVNSTSVTNGSVQIALEIGNYTFDAVYEGTKVYETTRAIVNATSFVLYCNLTNLKISVIAIKDKPIQVPETEIYVSRVNITLTTNINGTAIAHSLVPNTSYTLNASRYDESFNVTTLPTLLINQNVTAWYNVTFILPTLTLQINVTNAVDVPIPNAMVKVQESKNGLQYQNNTDNAGIAIISQCILGKYNITIYDADGLKLKETSVSVLNLTISIQEISITCSLSGLTLSINIVDYFGQPISNVNVTLQQDDLAPRSSITQSNGMASFSDITGGEVQIILYLSGRTQPSTTRGLNVTNSMTIGIKLEKYTMLAGFLVETTSLITAILIIASALLVVSIEVYRRRRSKPQQKPELESK
jgi:hypothetical protein